MPYVSVHIDLDEFDDDDLISELESRGYTCSKDSTTDSLGDLDHIEHLAICGQLDVARTEALQLVSAAIGRPI